MSDTTSRTRRLAPYLSMGAVLALSFGYAVGWGSFMMPGTTFLPNAGPLGTVIGMLLGGLVMCVFAWCYHVMMVKSPGPGGAFRFARRTFGDDHGFLVGWFLCLTYITVLWANATAVILLVRYTLGDMFQFGFHYSLAGFDIHFGEVLLALAAIALGGLVCLAGRRLTAHVQTLLAVLFAGAVAFVFGVGIWRHTGGLASMGPAFAPIACPRFMQVVGIFAMAPWAFVGYEAISHSAAEFKFPVRRSFAILLAAVVVSTFVYVALALLPVLARPEGYATWDAYIRDLPNLEGVWGVPVFAAAKTLLGPAGTGLIVAAMLAGQFTGIIATIVAMSRLMYAMSHEDILPPWFGELDRDLKPRRAMLAVIAFSFVVPFFGRAVIAWPVDLSSLGAALAFGYTAAAAFKLAGTQGTRLAALAGGVLSIAFCLLLLVPNGVTGNAMVTESYLLLAIWCVVVFFFYRRVFIKDRNHRFGQSIIVWVWLIVVIIFSSLMWVRESAHDIAKTVLHNVAKAPDGLRALPQEMQRMNELLHNHSFVEMVLLVIVVFIVISLLAILRRREKALTIAKTKAEDMNKAKSFFFSTVSHDIRTPLNAIIGFSQMLKSGFKTQGEHDEAVDSILVSSKTLLKLINDVLDLSKLESGRMQIQPEPTDCAALFREIVKAFEISNTKREVEIRSQIDEMPLLLIDPQRLRQIVFNLVGNAMKFTERGHVDVRAICTPHESKGTCTLRLEVEDTGCGISAEDLKKIFSPYVQVGSKASRHGGTGLGLAICRQLVFAMGGTPLVTSTLGKGSVFSADFPEIVICAAPAASGPKPQAASENKPQAKPEAAGEDKPEPTGEKEPARRRRILVADDQKMNLLVLKAMLDKLGSFDLTCVQNGREALDRLLDPAEEPFDLVLTDLWMPKMDGEGLVRAIRAQARLKTLRVYVITADVEVRKTYASLGFTGLLLKPVTLEGLQEILG